MQISVYGDQPSTPFSRFKLLDCKHSRNTGRGSVGLNICCLLFVNALPTLEALREVKLLYLYPQTSAFWFWPSSGSSTESPETEAELMSDDSR